MAVRDTESRWPRDSNGNVIAVENIGYAIDDANSTSGLPRNYVLVSYLPKRLFINSVNQYVVFVLNGQNITRYTWRIRRYLYEQNTLENLSSTAAPEDGRFYNIDQITENGIFSWRPNEEGRYNIQVTLEDSATTVATLSFDQNVFKPFRDDDVTREAMSVVAVNTLLSTQNNQLSTQMTMAAGDTSAIHELIEDLWEYICNESIHDAGNIIPVSVLARIGFRQIVSLNKANRDNNILTTGVNWQSLVADQIQLTGLGSISLGIYNVPIVSAAMIKGYITWQNKTNDPINAGVNSWAQVESTMHTGFLALPIETKIDIYNLLRFPLSCIRLVGDLIRRTTIETLPAASRNSDICEKFIRYISYNQNQDNAGVTAAVTTLSGDVALLNPFFLIDGPPETIAAADLQFVAGAPVPVNAEVNSLKNDLAQLGFRMAIEGVPDNVNNGNSPLDNSNTDGHFNLITEWAVKEFQIYSKMQFIAKEREGSTDTTPYHQKLRRYPNLLRYTGAVSGIANNETRTLIKLWKKLNWRCPVVISAFVGGNPGWNTIHTENIWRHDIFRDRVPRIFVQDYSGYWGQLPKNRVVGTVSNHDLYYDGKMALGTFIENARNDHYDGIVNTPRDFLWRGIWANDNASIVTVNNANQTTVNVVRSVILREAGIGFEVINSWDSAFLSLGYFHWTIGKRDRTNTAFYEEGELQGFLTYLKSNYSDTFDKCVRFFGLDTSDSNLLSCFNTTQKKYTSHFQSQNDNFTWITANRVRDTRQDINNGTVLHRQFYGNHNYHRTWHSFYRWVMALRIHGNNINSDFRTAMWNMARIRVRDLQDTNWGIDNTPGNDWKNIRDQHGNDIDPTFGDVFRSERAWALILRWHVNRPADIVNTNVSDTIKMIYHFARCGRLATEGINVDNWIANPRIRNNLGNATQINRNPFARPNTWARATGVNPTNMEMPTQANEEDFCRAIILYIRINVAGLHESMGIVYNDVANTTRNFVLHADGL